MHREDNDVCSYQICLYSVLLVTILVVYYDTKPTDVTDTQ